MNGPRTYQKGQHTLHEEGKGTAQALAQSRLPQVLKENDMGRIQVNGIKFISQYKCLEGLHRTHLNSRIQRGLAD